MKKTCLQAGKQVIVSLWGTTVVADLIVH